LALVAASLAILVLWMGLKRHLAPSNFSERKDFLQLLAQIVGGAALVIGLFFTWWNLRTTQKATTDSLENAQRTLAVSQEGQITERFTRAIEQLGNEKVEIRLGGIYALERIAKDSEKDYWTIIEVLSAFVREHAALNTNANQKSNQDVKPRTDIQAILTVLGRRQKIWTVEMGIDRMLDLSETNLQGVRLSEAHFEGTIFLRSNLKGSMLGGYFRSSAFNQAVLDGSNLSGNFESVNFGNASLRAVWFNAELTHAWFSGAHLEEAILSRNNLEKAVFDQAHLEGAYLEGANLRGAIFLGTFFAGARLSGAHLEGANLSEATGLTLEQIRGAYVDNNTKLPGYLTSSSPLYDSAPQRTARSGSVISETINNERAQQVAH